MIIIIIIIITILIMIMINILFDTFIWQKFNSKTKSTECALMKNFKISKNRKNVRCTDKRLL